MRRRRRSCDGQPRRIRDVKDWAVSTEWPLIAAISWSLVTLCGLGLIPFLALFPNRERRLLWGPPNWGQTLLLLLMLGILADYAVGLFFMTLRAQEIAAWIG